MKTRKHFLQPYPPTVALVTGASRGIGAAIARALAAIGLDLVLTSTKQGGARTTAGECRAHGVEVLELGHDAGSARDAQRVVKAALARFGQVDVLVNNAGMVIRRPVAKMTDADFDRQLSVNLSGPFYLTRRLLPGMVKRGLGRIINVSSISATLGTAGHTGYCASKWGLDGFTKALAEEVRGTGVMVVSVLPGSVDTQMLKGSGFPPMMAPWEIADVVRYLTLEAPLALNGGRIEVFGVIRADAAAVAKVKAALEAVLKPGQVSEDPDRLLVFGHDESDMGDFPPQLIVYAQSTADVQQVFRTAFAHGVPVTPVAARTGKSGGSLPLAGGVSLSLERMNQILSISPEDLTAVVQPGVITGALMKAADAVGLFYPPDPNSWEMCTLGGNIAENAGGPRALKYGVTRDYVLGMEWVLPTSEALRVGKRTIKGVAGYDLCGLFVGSEGTLGVATEITLQLIPRPRKVMTALVTFKGVIEAATAVSAVLASGVLPRCLELLDDVAIRAVDGKGFRFPEGTGGAVIVEVDGAHEDALLVELQSVSEIAAAHGAIETLIAQDESQREKLWAARRVVSTALRAMKPFKISEDIAVPRSKIPLAIARFKQLGVELGLTVATYGHAGDGNLHANILYEGKHQRPLVDQALEQMMRITVELGGTITGEHGVGYAKRKFLPFEQGPELIDFQKRLKAFIDPKGLLNPDKIFPLKD